MGVSRTLKIGVVVLLATITGGAVWAQREDPVRFDLVPEEGTEFVFGDRRYGGTMSVTWHVDGLAVIEEVPLDGYLAGIREVPLSWPIETLRAQAVAARTYLAWTLDRGRSADGVRYDFDICATTQCQVYAGTDVVRAPDGARWLQAIESTPNEILVFDGAPAQTLYSSSAGSRTRPVQDIWGNESKPYLVAVDSPEAGFTPYERWVVTLGVDELRRIFAAAGIRIGPGVRDISVSRPAEGGGPSYLVVDSDAGRTSIPATDVRTDMNIFGPVLYPGLLPARRPSGSRWPQAILSYTFDVEFDAGPQVTFPEGLPPSDLPSLASVTFVGEGWGHGVGMSQWGAMAMGEGGAGYATILGHYYGGLQPVDAGTAAPATVRVGLAWGLSATSLDATGQFELRANGTSIGGYGPGEWLFRLGAGGIGLLPPEVHAAASLAASRLWPR
jgi:stage II sporulation protein D